MTSRVVERSTAMERQFGLLYSPKVHKGVVLLSGGLDSTTVAWIAKEECEELYALTILYGQTHKREVDCARRLAKRLGVAEHKVLQLPLNKLTKSALFGNGNIPVEGIEEGIPSTWVPQRNSIFLSCAFAWAEVVGADRVYTGVNSVDYSGYPDCRPEFIAALNRALNLASKCFVEGGTGVQIHTPIMNLTKNKIVELGLSLGVPYQLTTSCYSGRDKACGLCDSCRIRRQAFLDNGMEDPIEYE